jgi:hypothetical protein
VPILFDCPECARPLRLSRRYAGLRGKCPRCMSSILVPELDRAIVDMTGSSVDLPAVRPEDLAAFGIEDAKPPSTVANSLHQSHDLARFAASPIPPLSQIQADLDMTECPRCAEKIKARAKVCRFCGTDFEAKPERRREEREDDERKPRRRRRGWSENRASHERPRASGQVFFVIGVVCGVVGLVIFPFVFGILAALFGLISLVANEGSKGVVPIFIGAADLVWALLVAPKLFH